MPWYVNKYTTFREYGGPEEGGCWYDMGHLEGTVSQFVDEEEAIAYREWLTELERKDREPVYHNRYSVLGGGDTEFFVEDHPGDSYPKEYPRYE